MEKINTNKRRGGKKFRRSKNKSELSPEEIHVDMIAALIVKIKLSDTEINEKHEEFMKKYPNGKITREDFLLESKNGLEETRCFPAQSLFRVFDTDGNGSMDFSEYMMATNCCNLTSQENILDWIFNVFDEDAGGFIDRKEIENIVISLSKMTETEADEDQIQEAVMDILEAIDEDGNEEISKIEFIENAKKIKFISNILARNK